MHNKIHDIAIIGGGVNGCGIARDAAGRGLSVLLAERGDIAGATSSASSKLVHGGLRYLEHYEFSLVREALKEREVLWKIAPHIIRPLRFILPHHSALRPAWLIRLGLFIYDHLGGRKKLPASHMVDLRRDITGKPLKKKFARGFEYSDCAVDDARLVVLNAVDAAAMGAQIRVRCKMLKAERADGVWNITLQDTMSMREEIVRARVLVNAAGPWVGQVSAASEGVAAAGSSIRLVKGSHIVVPKMFDHGRAYILQNRDERIVFAIPFEHDFTLIGTTDVDMPGGPGEVEASAEEIEYLCNAVNEYFDHRITPNDVLWSFAGIRPLYNDGSGAAQETTRDHVLELQAEAGAPPLLSIYGGKITAYREVSEEVMAKLAGYFTNAGPEWTGDKSLPGGDFDMEGFEGLVDRFCHEYSFLPQAMARRLCHAYGTRAGMAVSGAQSLSDLGRCFGADLYEREVQYLRANEWALSVEDILWRRSKLGLRLSSEETENLAKWLDKHPASVPDAVPEG